MFPPWSDIYIPRHPAVGALIQKTKKTPFRHGHPMPKSALRFKKPVLQATQMSRVLSALLCSALLCSAVSIWRLFHPCHPLFTSFFKILGKAKGKAKPQLYRRKAAIPTREISRRFPADRLQLADPMGPCSFAPPACAGFADSIYRCVQYTILPQNCKRKAAIFIANCSKFLQILHRAGNMPIAR